MLLCRIDAKGSEAGATAARVTVPTAAAPCNAVHQDDHESRADMSVTREGVDPCRAPKGEQHA